MAKFVKTFLNEELPIPKSQALQIQQAHWVLAPKTFSRLHSIHFGVFPGV